MSTESGTSIAFVMLQTTAASFSTGSTLPSRYPSAHATPALVVAIAFAPVFSNKRALPASQAFGRTSKLVELWRSRNVLANFDITLIALILCWSPILWRIGKILELLRRLSLVKLEESCRGVSTSFFEPLMPDPPFKSAPTAYIYFPQVGTILCYSIKTVPKADVLEPRQLARSQGASCAYDSRY